MLHRDMPESADPLSILGFGCVRLRENDRTIDEERAMRRGRHAIGHGVNYIDTVWMPYRRQGFIRPPSPQRRRRPPDAGVRWVG